MGISGNIWEEILKHSSSMKSSSSNMCSNTSKSLIRWSSSRNRWRTRVILLLLNKPTSTTQMHVNICRRLRLMHRWWHSSVGRYRLQTTLYLLISTYRIDSLSRSPTWVHGLHQYKKQHQVRLHYVNNTHVHTHISLFYTQIIIRDNAVTLLYISFTRHSW